MSNPVVIVVGLLLLLFVLALVAVANSIINTRLRWQAGRSRQQQDEAMRALLEAILVEMRKGGDAGYRREKGAGKQYDEERRAREIESERKRCEEDERRTSHEEERRDFLAKKSVNPPEGNENISTYGGGNPQHFMTRTKSPDPDPDPAAALWRGHFERWAVWRLPSQEIQLRELRPEEIYDSFNRIYSELEKGSNEEKVLRYHMEMNNMYYLFRAAAFIDTYYEDEQAAQDLRPLVVDSVEFVRQRLSLYSLVPIIPIPLTPLEPDCEGVGLGMNRIVDKNIQKIAYEYYSSMPPQDGRKTDIVGDIEVVGLKTEGDFVLKKAKAKLITLEWRSHDSL